MFLINFSYAYLRMVANVDPSQSWAARWQRIDKYTTGIYAIQVIGRLPEDVIDTLRGRGLTYIPRDGGQVAVDE
jgi:transcription elongation factor SPT4